MVLRTCDEQSLLQRLPVIPVEICREPILDAIGWREQAQHAGWGFARADLFDSLVADRQGPGREFDEYLGGGVNKMATFFGESQLPKTLAKLSAGYRAFLDKVEIVRDVFALRPDCYAAPPVSVTVTPAS